MSKVLVDTDIWVDIVLNRPRFADASKGAVMACLERGDEVIVAATSLKDIFYFAEKSAGADAGYRAVELILDIATPAAVDGIVCRTALSFERPDYEDGIVAACAIAESADAVISRDEGAFTELAVTKYHPGELLEARGFQPIDL